MKYAVTYCTMDNELGSNILWHSCLLFSKMNEDQKKFEVIDNWGFYGVPSTSNSDSWLTKLKITAGLDVDLYGNHGMLRHEQLRFLDLGYGLHGVTFELTQEKFELLHDKCKGVAKEQEAAIKEVVETQGLIGKKAHEKTRMYAHEEFSPIIYALEQIKAKQQGREPRLKPFELHLDWGLKWPSISQSSNCKTRILQLLATVLSKEQIERLNHGGLHPTIPRLSGVMESIYLHSTGPFSTHIRASGQAAYFREGTNPEVKLFWTLPPQEMEALSQDTINLFEVDKEYCQDIKGVIRKLQSLEWLLRNAQLPPKYEQYRVLLLEKIINYYTVFSRIESKQDAPKISEITGLFCSWFSYPKDAHQARLQDNIQISKQLFNSLYMAIVDGWTIDDCYLTEIDSDMENSNTLEAIVSYLSITDQKKLCQIIRRRYCEPEFSTEEDENNSISPTALSS